MARPPPTPIYTLRSFEVEDITALFFIAAEDNLRITKTNEPALLTGSSKGNICFWNLVTFRVKHKLVGHNGRGILALFLCKNHIVSHGRDGHINSWLFDGKMWTIDRTFASAEIGFCSAETLIRESSLRLIIPYEKRLSIVDYESKNVCSQIESESHGMCMCVKAKMLEDTTYIFCGYEDGFIVVWNCDSLLEVSSLQCEKETVFCLDVDLEHRRRGVSGMPEGALQVWDISENFQLSLYRQIPLKNEGVNAVAIRTDGKIMISGGCDGSVRVFSWKSLKPLAVMYQETTVSCLSFSNCTDVIRKHKSVFATGSKEGTISLWSIY